MKKIIILKTMVMTMAIIAVNAWGQSPNADSLNFREYEDLYYLPDPVMTKCITLDASTQYGNPPIFPSGSGQIEEVELFYKIGLTTIMDVAQPYIVQDTLEITGVSVYFYKIQYGAMFPYVGIADASFNFMAKVPVPSYHNDPDKLTPFCRYRELFFDEPVKVKGSFYVMYDNPKPLPGYNWDVSLPISDYKYLASTASIQKFKGNINNCDSDTLPTVMARIFQTDYASTKIDSTLGVLNWTGLTNSHAAFMFPILKEPITQTEIDEESAAVLYGNSYQVTDTIERNDSTILRTATIVCDTSLSADTIVHLYMHNTNHKDSIIKGDTTITCDTLNIQYTYVTNSLNNPTLERFTSVFPNPADKELNVLCSYKIKSIEIYDERGVIVEKINKVNSYSRVIDIQKYNKGNYVLKVITNSGSVNKKFVVQ